MSDWNSCPGKIAVDSLQKQIDNAKDWSEVQFKNLYDKDRELRKAMEERIEKINDKVDAKVQEVLRAVSNLKIWILMGLLLFISGTIVSPLITKLLFP